MEKILKDLIEFNTVNDKENEKIRNYLEKFLTPLNFTFESIGEGSKKVLIATRGISNLGFICHTDTVSASKFWSYNPYTLTRQDDKLIGLGASDMKGGIASLLCALKELDKSIPITCFFTFDEEINFEGINMLINAKKDFPKTLIFPEPTDLEPILANKGCLEFKMQVLGKSTHSGTPNLGDNAILKSMKIIEELNSFAESLKHETNSLYEIPYTTFNMAMINGGTALNIVPDLCEISFDFRTINKKQEPTILTFLEEIARKYDAKLEIINKVSCAITENEDFKNKIEEICGRKTSGVNYVTEASFFQDKNILILGPGPVTAHRKDEYILKSSYLNTIEIYKKIIKELSNEKGE